MRTDDQVSEIAEEKDDGDVSSKEATKAKLLQLNWIDWMSVLISPLRTKHAKFLEEVVAT